MSSEALLPFSLIIIALLNASPAHAHIGTKDVFETDHCSGPYKLFVTVRMPNCHPRASPPIEVRVFRCPPIDTILIVTPITPHRRSFPAPARHRTP